MATTPTNPPATLPENLKKVSLILFIVLGLIHILSGFLMASAIGLPLTFITNRVMAIPFAMTALIYSLASIKTGLKDQTNKMIDKIFIAFTLLIFIILIYITLLLPDKLA